MLERKPHHKRLQRSTKPWRSKSRLKPIGKNSLPAQKREWNAQWKKDFAHITWCESCGVPDGYGENKLTQAHSRKQRFITTREGCFESAWLCIKCHRALDEAMGEDVHERMYNKIMELIARRD